MKQLPIELPQPNKLVKLSPDLYWGRLPLPFRLDHINLFIIDTDKGWVIIDAGIFGEKTRQYWKALLSGILSTKPVDKIIITHHHVDHIGFASELAKMTGAECYSSLEEISHANFLFNLSPSDFSELLASKYTSYGLPKREIALGRNDSDRYLRYVPELPNFKEFSEADTIFGTYSSWRCRIDCGHSSGQISLINDLDKLFLPTDFLLPRISPNISADLRNADKNVLGDYLNYLQEMSLLDPMVKIFPGHDWPFVEGNARARVLIEHHKKRLDLLLSEAKKRPITVSDGIDVLFGRRFQSHELFFAAGEARAHLTDLMHSNKVIKEIELRDGCEVDVFTT
ncbi:MBL fold metallo-hydrolase [Alphaproteobacteria bacterium]|nr:MBL fold metallo-hydrolase [Alphaproteobacteria bacterium]